GRDLDDDRHAPRTSGDAALSSRHDPLEQLSKCGRRLQVTQPWRVLRGEVDSEIACHVIERPDPKDVIERPVHRVLVGADVDAHDAEPGPALQSPQSCLMAVVVEAEPIDDCAMTDQAEHPRARISRLRPWRHTADLGKSKADPQNRIRYAGVLVE